MTDPPVAAFTGLVDLAAEELGGALLATSDEFFAEARNLLKPGRGVFRPEAFTERGKWMDGWESRRRRGAGHDSCVIRLGARGRLRGLDIDTHHFVGNHAPYASVDATQAESDADVAALEHARWVEILPQAPLRPDAQNLFAVSSADNFSHVRLNIYPDGGVARFRAYGEVEPDWTSARVDDRTAPLLHEGEVDLAALRHGGLALACSDMFFGPMNQLILPGRPVNMGGGWETRRRRGPGRDWIVLRLAARGTIGLVEVDTLHFKGNYPERCSLEGVNAPGARITDLLAGGWQELLRETRLDADRRHFFRDELGVCGPFTHVRLNIFPDGGVSRLRVYGVPSLPPH